MRETVECFVAPGNLALKAGKSEVVGTEAEVAQIFNLLCRGSAIRRRHLNPNANGSSHA